MTTKTTTSPLEAVTAALAAHPGATPFELALATGLGRSTVNKHLATLERDGTVIRGAGGHAGGRRVADRWRLSSDSEPEQVTPTTPAHDGVDVDNSRPKEPVGEGDETPAAASGSEATDVGTNRLGRGQLTELVVGYLVERAGESAGPSAIAKALGRSSGAVANACERLVETGKVRRTSDSPRRYEIAS